MTNDTIGVDISNDHLDADRMADGASCRFANGNAGCKMLINWIGSLERRVVFEPTGPYLYKSGFDPTVNVRLRHSFNGGHYG